MFMILIDPPRSNVTILEERSRAHLCWSTNERANSTIGTGNWNISMQFREGTGRPKNQATVSDGKPSPQWLSAHMQLLAQSLNPSGTRSPGKSIQL